MSSFIGQNLNSLRRHKLQYIGVSVHFIYRITVHLVGAQHPLLRTKFPTAGLRIPIFPVSVAVRLQEKILFFRHNK